MEILKSKPQIDIEKNKTPVQEIQESVTMMNDTIRIFRTTKFWKKEYNATVEFYKLIFNIDNQLELIEVLQNKDLGLSRLLPELNTYSSLAQQEEELYKILEKKGEKYLKLYEQTKTIKKTIKKIIQCKYKQEIIELAKELLDQLEEYETTIDLNTTKKFWNREDENKIKKIVTKESLFKLTQQNLSESVKILKNILTLDQEFQRKENINPFALNNSGNHRIIDMIDGNPYKLDINYQDNLDYFYNDYYDNHYSSSFIIPCY